MERPDKVTKIGQSIIQHGPFNDRVYLIKLHLPDYPIIINEIKQLAESNQYSKIFAKVPSAAVEGFILNGFEKEASIPDFYGYNNAVYFMSFFRSSKRKEFNDFDTFSNIMELSKTWDVQPNTQLPSGWSSFRCGSDDIPEMASIYREVFPTYPFPIHDPDYLKKTMEENVRYYGVRDNECRLLALSSADVENLSSSCEMTDFATLPSARGHHCASHLLALMETDTKESGVKTAFTIARSISPGMNKVFKQGKYLYGGTMKKNTNIGGAMEDMNVWYKSLSC